MRQHLTPNSEGNGTPTLLTVSVSCNIKLFLVWKFIVASKSYERNCCWITTITALLTLVQFYMEGFIPCNFYFLNDSFQVPHQKLLYGPTFCSSKSWYLLMNKDRIRFHLMEMFTVFIYFNEMCISLVNLK